MLKLTALTLAAALAGGMSQAATLTFDEAEFGVGSAVTGFNVGGVTGSITADGGVDTAIIFDSTTLSGGDPDLVAPFFLTEADKDDNVNGIAPGNILIIAENSDFSDPDDNGSGGTITFSFDTLVNFTGFRVFDDVDNFVVTSDLGETSTSVSLDFDNAFADVVTNFTNVSELTFNFGSASGAIDNLQFTPVSAVPLPASLPMLLLGFGAIGAAARRKTKSS